MTNPELADPDEAGRTPNMSALSIVMEPDLAPVEDEDRVVDVLIESLSGVILLPM